MKNRKIKTKKHSHILKFFEVKINFQNLEFLKMLKKCPKLATSKFTQFPYFHNLHKFHNSNNSSNQNNHINPNNKVIKTTHINAHRFGGTGPLVQVNDILWCSDEFQYKYDLHSELIAGWSSCSVSRSTSPTITVITPAKNIFVDLCNLLSKVS